MKHTNPFVVRGYRGPEYVCVRDLETMNLASARGNERSAPLLAPQRYGKTGPIRNAG